MDSDEALFARVIAGDMLAFDRLYARYERPLYGFLRAQLRDAAEAEDVLQETFLALLRQRTADVDRFKPWIYQVARHLVLNRARTRARAEKALEAFAAEPLSDVADGSSERPTAALTRAVAQLPAPLAEVYHLRASGLSYEELATTLAMPVGTVKSRIHEMVRRLRAAMAEET